MLGPRPSLALGIAAKASEYALAVRLFDQSPSTLRVAEVARTRAAGEADVRYVGLVSAPRRVPKGGQFRKRIRPVAPGYSIGHKDVTAGTLGAFVDKGGYVCVLSNYHVLAKTNRGRLDDSLLQPGTADGGRSRDEVGWLVAFEDLRPSGNLIDAAIGYLSDDVDYAVKYQGRVLEGVREEVDLNDSVSKVGRTTGVTRGTITAIELDGVAVDYSDAGDGSLLFSFDGQLEIQGRGRGVFSQGGDSGSLIIGADDYAVGLLFAGSETGVTYANPIGEVLDAFDVEIITE